MEGGCGVRAVAYRHETTRFALPEQVQVPVFWGPIPCVLGQSAENSWRFGFNRVTGARPRRRRAIGSAGAAVLLFGARRRASLGTEQQASASALDVSRSNT